MLGSRGEFVAGRCQRDFGAGRSTPWQPNSAPARERAWLFERVHHRGPRRPEGFDQCRRSPAYELLSQRGPEHEKTFVVQAVWEGIVLGQGKGRSKKQAENEAAKEALRALGEETVVKSAAVIIDLGYECLSAWTVTPKCEAHRKCRAIESVTNFLACVIAPSRDRPLARAAVIAAEYVQPVP